MLHEELAMIIYDPAAHHTRRMGRIAHSGHNYCNKIARREHHKAEDSATATAATPATIQQKPAEREARRRQLAEAATKVSSYLESYHANASDVVGTEIV